MKNFFLAFRERIRKHGKKALILWLCWVTLKWTLFLYFGGTIWRYFYS